MPEALQVLCNVAGQFHRPQAAAELAYIECRVQVFSECTSVQDTVGMANGGISSDIAKYMHRKQGVYG